MDKLKEDEKILTEKIEKLKTKNSILLLIKKIIAIFIILYLVLNFIFGLKIVKGIQMNPKIGNGDLVVFYRIPKEYRVEDVVVAKANNQEYVLRIVAIGGQTVDIKENGELLVDNHTLEEEIYYKTYKKENSSVVFPYKLKENEVFLLGDFRTETNDSRNFGPILKKDLKGKVINVIKSMDI